MDGSTFDLQTQESSAPRCNNPIVIRVGTSKLVRLARCRECLQCRQDDAAMWAGRMCLELGDHRVGRMRTFTYGDAREAAAHSLEGVRRWIRQRRRDGQSFRYFMVGELGGLNGRFHVHLADFGTAPEGQGKRYRDPLWPEGLVHDRPLTRETAAYVAKYVSAPPDGRAEEARLLRGCRSMSNRPGIGSDRLRQMGAGYAAMMGGRLAELPQKFTVGQWDYPLIEGARLAFEQGFVSAGGRLPMASAEARAREADEVARDFGPSGEREARWKREAEEVREAEAGAREAAALGKRRAHGRPRSLRGPFPVRRPGVRHER